MKLPVFTARTPDAITASGTDHISKQVRILMAAGFDEEAVKQFIMRTDEADYATRFEAAKAIRLHVHIAAQDIGEIMGCQFDPEHIFSLMLKSELTVAQVVEEICNIRAQHDMDTTIDTTPKVHKGDMHQAVYAARAEQVANHGR